MILKNRYQNIELIDFGGHSKIYKAFDNQEHQIVVLKKTDHEKAIVEFEVLQAMNHPIFPKVYDFFTEGGHSYIAMEYIEGATLLKLKGEKQISKKKIYTVMLEVGNGLRMLHNMRPAIIWGDLKPSNIMLTREGAVKLIDFGTAVIDYGNVNETARYGTRFYAAPEQYNQEGFLDERSDIYAFGATFHCLLGKHGGKYYLNVLEQCMALDKGQRYQTAAELLYRLRQ